MPLFIDVHKKIDGLTAEAAAAAHARDLEVQGKFGFPKENTPRPV